MPITFTVTVLAPSGAGTSKSVAIITLPRWTVARVSSGQSRCGQSTVIWPSIATVLPRAMTRRIGRVFRSDVRITSARRPGAIDPSSRSSPKWVAVFTVAI